jgi:predicted  nucleic acid-binding Zn-ribbon protein
VEGKDEILAAMEVARTDSEALRRESEALKWELTSMQTTVGQLTKQLDAERSQREWAARGRGGLVRGV